ncbi:hypothetical protein PENANT_c024G08276 [Penicillium antarcticum]|uniref:Uncharacterized protein n=1 Tax=Penicillium antarcticum TaxID=416450 RepID=A0A1V6PZJ9_9EURO|nr:hypothetical protein PENANT_c024G08276 [Penicillium antarcticum]
MDSALRRTVVPKMVASPQSQIHQKYLSCFSSSREKQMGQMTSFPQKLSALDPQEQMV